MTRFGPRAQLLALALAAPPALPAGQLAGQESRLPGAVETGLVLRQADGVKRVLAVAAHPDDEDTSLLATLARGWGAETAYFSLTRGEGGQNLIGDELGVGLGIIRSGELLAARAIDGARQYFSRAFDFGYSKTAAETFDKWPREAVLADLVWTIRRFRPHVVVSMFTGTPVDGHGHHQAAGQLALEAYEAAGDEERFPEQLAQGVEPWAPAKFYRRPLGVRDAPGLEIPTGTLDPLLGVTHHQLAMASRSEHRSQDFGTALTPGPRSARLGLVASRVEAGAEAGLFAGIDTTLAGLAAAELGPMGRSAAEAYREALRQARANLLATEPQAALPALAEALRRAESLAEAAGPGELRRELARRAELLGRAALAAAGARIELRALEDVLAPGQEVIVEARVWSGSEAAAEAPVIVTPLGWTVTGLGSEDAAPPEDLGNFARFFRVPEPTMAPGSEARLAGGELARWRYAVTVAPDAQPSSPWFLAEPREGDAYRWPDDPELRALPFQGPVLRGRVAVTLAGVRIEVERPVRARKVDGALGESWHPVLVAPAVSVTPVPELLVWPTGGAASREIAFRLEAHAPATGEVELELPPGWSSSPERAAFRLPAAGAVETVAFEVRAPADAEGAFAARPVLLVNGETRPAIRVAIIDYPHIEARLIASDPAARITRFPVQVAERRIGYVMGSGDVGPEAIRRLGLGAELIEPGDWAGLERFDAIVLGVRAYEVRPDLAAANEALLDWVAAGGTLVTQYNRYEFNEGDYAPRPIAIERPAPRVTREDAPVALLNPASPALSAPNTIGPADFEGWVQERGLYFPTSWDDAYSPLLEMADPGEPPRRGSLLVAPHGRGLYIHTSLSFFRQLRAGVPGAYRLWANLISLDGDRWRELASQ